MPRARRIKSRLLSQTAAARRVLAESLLTAQGKAGVAAWVARMNVKAQAGRVGDDGKRTVRGLSGKRAREFFEAEKGG